MVDSNIRPIMNLGNSIVGVSILAMPYCFSQCGVLLATVLLVTCTLLTQWTCKMLMKAAVMTGNQSYENLALGVLGAMGKYVTGLSVIGLNLGTCIAFFVIIGDLAPPIIAQATGVHWSANFLRALILILAAVFVVFPLAMLRSVDSLSGISVASLIFYAFLAFQLLLQCRTAPWGWWNAISLWKNTGLLKCIPIFALAYSCQTQLFIIYSSMHDSGFRRIADVINGATISVASLYFMVALFGYISFYSVGVKGDVLANFDLSFFPQLSRAGFSLSVMVSFPLMIFPCRVSINSLFFSSKSNELHVVEPIPQKRFVAITAFIIVSTLAVAILVPNVETVLSLTGATMGTAISFIIPSVIFLKVAGGSSEFSNRAKLCLVVGLSVMILSTTTIIQAEMNQVSAADKPSQILTPLQKPVPFEKLPPKQVNKQPEKQLPEQIEKLPGNDKGKKGDSEGGKKGDPEPGGKVPPGDAVEHQVNEEDDRRNIDKIKPPPVKDEVQEGGHRRNRLQEGQLSREGVQQAEKALPRPPDEERAKRNEQPVKQSVQVERHESVNDPQQQERDQVSSLSVPGPMLPEPNDNGNGNTIERGTQKSMSRVDDNSEIHDKLQKDVSKLHERLNQLEEENKNLKQRQEAIEGIEVEKLLEGGDGARQEKEPVQGLKVKEDAGDINAKIAVGHRTILEAEKGDDQGSEGQRITTEKHIQHNNHHDDKEIPKTSLKHDIHRRDVNVVNDHGSEELINTMENPAEKESIITAGSTPQRRALSEDDRVDAHQSHLESNLTSHPVLDTSKVSTTERRNMKINSIKAVQRDLKTIR